MPLSIPVVWTDAHRRHGPDAGIWIGIRIPADERPERAEAIRSALEVAGASVVQAEPHSDDALHAVRDPRLVSFLREAWAGFRGAGRRLAALGLPTVLVQEGGYEVTSIGARVRAVLEGFEERAQG